MSGRLIESFVVIYPLVLMCRRHKQMIAIVANDDIVVMPVAPSTVLRLIDFQLEPNLLAVCIPICWPLFRSVPASTTE